jgi:hypothetical protein
LFHSLLNKFLTLAIWFSYVSWNYYSIIGFSLGYGRATSILVSYSCHSFISWSVAWEHMHRFSLMSMRAIMTLCFHSSFGSMPR